MTAKELMGGLASSLNGWPGNQGTRTHSAGTRSGGGAEEYRSNSGRDDSRERPALIDDDELGCDDYDEADEPYCVCDLDPIKEELASMTCACCGKEICP